MGIKLQKDVSSLSADAGFDLIALLVVVDCLDEWLDFAAFRHAGFGHSAGHARGVALDTADEGVRELRR